MATECVKVKTEPVDPPEEAENESQFDQPDDRNGPEFVNIKMELDVLVPENSSKPEDSDAGAPEKVANTDDKSWEVPIEETHSILPDSYVEVSIKLEPGEYRATDEEPCSSQVTSFNNLQGDMVAAPVALPGPSKNAVTTYHQPELEQINNFMEPDNEGDDDVASDEDFFDAGDNFLDDGDDDYVGSSDTDCDGDDAIESIDNGGNAMEDEWTLHRSRVVEFPTFNRVQSCTVPEETNSPMDFFKILFSDQFLNDLVTATNTCARDLSHNAGRNSRIGQWKDISDAELLTFIGILFHMGNIKLNRCSDYWRQHYLYNLFPGKFFSRNRFFVIFRCLRFGQNNLDSIINYFNQKMTEVFCPGENLTIDESMILHRGRSGIRQYIQGKRHKYGIKLYILATPGGLTLQLHMYKGKRNEEVGGQGHTNKIVAKLLQKYLNTGRHVYMDNFYNSIDLTEYLVRHKTNVTGTLRAKRKGNPAIVCNNKLSKGGLIYRYNRSGACVCKWRDQKDVLCISTKHTPKLNVIINKRGQSVLKPEMVIEYNKFMNGVDRQDLMMSYYTCEHKTMRWYKKVGIHIMQIMLLNAYFMYKIKCNSNMDYYKFREVIITSLLPSALARPLGNVQDKENVIHLPEHLPKDEKGNTKRRRCKHCWDTKKIRKNCLIFCPDCPCKPGLCLECFRPYHKYN